MKRRVAQIAGVEGLLEGNVRRGDILPREISCERIRNHDRVVSLVEVCEVAAILLEPGKNLPA